MSQTKKSKILWFLALSVTAAGTLAGPLYFNFWVEKNLKESVAVIAPIYKDGAIAKAKKIHAEEVEKREAQEKAIEQKKTLIDQYGISFFFRSEFREEKAIKVLNRIQQNKRLAEALQYAKEEGVFTQFVDSGNFYVWERGVNIPMSATDEEIITFLLGSSAKDKASQ